MGFFSRLPKRDAELREEIRVHLEMAVRERMARGESRKEAEREARREFGNELLVREVTREMWGGAWLERLTRDVRYGVRALRRTPAFTATAVLTLALAIGANSAVFTVVNSVLLRPLPFRDPGRLFLVSYMPTDLPFEVSPGLADWEWLGYRSRERSFERVAGYARQAVTLSGAGEAARLPDARVSASFFQTLGVAPAIGRSFTPAEEARGRDGVVVLGDALWRERFGGDPAVLGTSISLDGIPHTVIGVMPPGFTFPAGSELWTPLVIELNPHNSFLFSVLGRLRGEATPAQARRELASIMESLPRASQEAERHSHAAILPLKETLVGNAAPSLLIFAGAVGFVLLIACVNTANLLLIRAATRRHEMAVRVALGAGRLRIARQLLTEAALVGLAGGALGILLAQLGVRVLVAIAPSGRIPRLDEVHLDGRVLAFTIVLSLLTGVAFGLLPALQSARRAPQEAMAHGTRVAGGVQSGLRGALVSAEIALALVLLAGAGLMIKSFLRMRSADKGYDASGVTTMAADLPQLRYPDAVHARAFHAALLGRLSSIRGVRSAGAVSYTPMGDVGIMGNFTVDGATPLPAGYNVDKSLVSPGYFATMGVRLLRGRDFAESDDADAPGVAIVSESVARRVWPGGEAVGRRISMADKPGPGDWLTVVGVVADVVQDRSMLKHSTIYLPYLQSDWTFLLGHMTYVVRAAPGAGVARAMRAALRDVDRTVPAQHLQTMDDALLEVAAEPLFQTRLLGVFSALALVLAAIGTYGVLAYDVAERTREIAVRMALGATPGGVIGLVLRRTGVLALLGAAVGLAGSLALSGVLTGSLYDVEPTDTATLFAVVAAMLGVALVAGIAPALRAARVPLLTSLAGD